MNTQEEIIKNIEVKLSTDSRQVKERITDGEEILLGEYKSSSFFRSREVALLEFSFLELKKSQHV
jgi:hypothetical protein